MVIARTTGFSMMMFVALGCGGAPAVGGSPGETPATSDAPVCNEVPEVEHPSYSSENLTLELRQHQAHAAMVVPPFEFEANTRENLPGPVEMELTIHDPTGETHSQRFSYSNMREQCDPYCLPSGPVNNCGPRRCRMVRFRPSVQRVDHTIYQGSRPGRWTFVLHRLDNDDRVSVSLQLFEGESLEGEACEALPLQIGDFTRASCQRGIVPLGTTTNHWGIKAHYLSGNCRANAFALPLSDGTRATFDEGPYNAAPERSFPEGTVHETRLGERIIVRAWLAHHHLYILAGQDNLPGYDAFVRRFLEVLPNVDGPIREIPSCDATFAVTEARMPPTPMAALTADNPGFNTHFEGNRPSGLRVRFHNQHPLALAGLRRHEIIHTVNGVRLNGRRDLRALLEPMTRPGRMDIVLARPRVTQARCIRLTIEEPPALPPPTVTTPPDTPTLQQAPPPPVGPRRGRHCERRSDTCWDCVEFTFPAAVGCDRRCRRGGICVQTGGQEECLEPTRICCQDGQTCNVPPACEDAASSCASDTAGGPNQRCTFLSTCAQPLPSR